jgi:hypothetical protein
MESSRICNLVVGGLSFKVKEDLLIENSEYFKALLSGKFKENKDETIYIERSASAFTYILDLLNGFTDEYKEEYKEDLDFYMIKCEMDEPNDLEGSKQRFPDIFNYRFTEELIECNCVGTFNFNKTLVFHVHPLGIIKDMFLDIEIEYTTFLDSNFYEKIITCFRIYRNGKCIREVPAEYFELFSKKIMTSLNKRANDRVFESKSGRLRIPLPIHPENLNQKQRYLNSFGTNDEKIRVEVVLNDYKNLIKPNYTITPYISDGCLQINYLRKQTNSFPEPFYLQEQSSLFETYMTKEFYFYKKSCSKIDISFTNTTFCNKIFFIFEPKLNFLELFKLKKDGYDQNSFMYANQYNYDNGIYYIDFPSTYEFESNHNYSYILRLNNIINNGDEIKLVLLFCNNLFFDPSCKI